MPSPYVAPIDDIRFCLEAFGYNELVGSVTAFEDFDLETAMAMVEEMAKYSKEVLEPLNRVGDEHGIGFDGETHEVTLAPGSKEAYQGFIENGFMSLVFDPEYGGMGAPFAVGAMANEVAAAANKSLLMVAALSAGLIDAIHAHGSEEQKEKLLPKLISGEWSGTMCLTEPHCGTDLGLISTRAVPFEGHYKLTGSKIWITFGDHDLTENILHFVLARLPDAPPGIKGISVFAVPKFLDDGTRNPVFCTGLEHKMGIHASPTCVMSFEDAEGWLVGEEHRGMRSMFTMMNAARLTVGAEGLALGEAAYQCALAFAKDRRQGRSLDPSKQERGEKADTILVHPDVRRMLLTMKSTNEGLRGLVAWLGICYDLMHHAEDEAERQRAGDLVALLTPIAKSYGSERGFLNTSEAMQLMGGAGYTTDWPVEQYMRDIRIGMIYEGTNHIQALDLVGRKLPSKNGRLMQTFAGEITKVLRSTKGVEKLAPFREALKVESKRLTEVTMSMAPKMMGDRELAGAVANAYLSQFSLVVMAYVWLRQLEVVVGRGDDNERSKFQSARFFFEILLPEAELFAKRIAVGKEPMTEIDVALL